MRPANRFRRGIVNPMVSAEEIATMRAHPDHVLQDMLVTLEDYISYATEQRWLDCIEDKEMRASVIKSELGRTRSARLIRHV
jgi:hypothetical protein